MPDKNVKTKVGFTIFAGIIVLLLFILMIGTDDYLFSKTYNLNLYLENATGLVKGAPVTLGGYKVGEVEEINFIPANDKEAIEIKLRILEDYRSRITSSSHAEVSSIGILGDKFINITVGLPNETALAQGATIPVVKSLSLENLTSKLTPGLDNLNNILNNLSAISDTIAAGRGDIGRLVMQDKISSEMEKSLSQVNLLLQNINNKKGSLGKLISDESLYTNMVNVSADLEELLNQVKTGEGTLGKLFVDDSLYNNINLAGKNVNALFEKNGDDTVVNGLLTDEELYTRLMESIENINSLVKDIKINPDKYINVSVF